MEQNYKDYMQTVKELNREKDQSMYGEKIDNSNEVDYLISEFSREELEAIREEIVEINKITDPTENKIAREKLINKLLEKLSTLNIYATSIEEPMLDVYKSVLAQLGIDEYSLEEALDNYNNKNRL